MHPRQAGKVRLLHSAIHNASVAGPHRAQGGAIGVHEGGRVELDDVILSDSSASEGVAIHSLTERVTASLLTIRQSCEGEDVYAALIETDGDAGALLLRNLTVDAPGCRRLVANHTTLLQCPPTSSEDSTGSASGEVVCEGPSTICVASDAIPTTPLCKCLPNDLVEKPYVPWVPSPAVPSATLAPYSSYGCVAPPLEAMQLNPNRWRCAGCRLRSRVHSCDHGATGALFSDR